MLLKDSLPCKECRYGSDPFHRSPSPIRLVELFQLSFLQLQPCTPSQSSQLELAVTYLLYQRIHR